MVRFIIGILLIVFGIAIYIFVDKKERFYSNSFKVLIFNWYLIPSDLIILVFDLITLTGIFFIIY